MWGEFCLNMYKIMDELYKLNFKSNKSDVCIGLV